MRLCLNDADLGAPYRNITRAQLQHIYDIGFRLAGMHPDIDATDDDIRKVQDLFGEVGLEFGPLGVSLSAVRPDPSEERDHLDRIRRHLVIGGKLGCTTLRYSVGSMNPTNIWNHHPDNHTQRALDRLVENTRKLAPVAEDNGIVLSPETCHWTIVNTIPRMMEFVDRVDSPYVRIVFDPVNHMTPERVYESGRFTRCAIETLGDRIGVLHVKDCQIATGLVCHIDEADVGTGLFDHESVIRASDRLEPWKTFSLEHFRSHELWKPAFDHIQGVADRIGHTWTDPRCSHDRWLRGECK